MAETTVGALAELVGGVTHGDPDRPITGVCDLRMAGPEQIGFLNDVKLESAAKTTGAGALIVKRMIESPASLIVVDSVYASFAKVALWFHPLPRAAQHSLHESAWIDESARIEEPVEIGPRCVVESGVSIGSGTVCKPGVVLGEGCSIGKDCVLYSGVILYPGVTLGDRVVLHGGCVIGADGFGYARERSGRYVKFPQLGTVVIEDDVEVGANTAIDRGALNVTRIGRGSKLDNLVMVGHNCQIGEDVVVAGCSAFSGSTEVGDRSVIGGHVVCSGHLKIGADVRVGGASVIIRDLKEPGDYMGYPVLEKRRWLRGMRSHEQLIDIHAEVKELKRRVGL